MELVSLKGKADVLVVFPDVSEKVSPRDASILLRSSGKGEGLVKKLLESRAEDMTLGGNHPSTGSGRRSRMVNLDPQCSH
jgi:hypothetical protein